MLRRFHPASPFACSSLFASSSSCRLAHLASTQSSSLTTNFAFVALSSATSSSSSFRFASASSSKSNSNKKSRKSPAKTSKQESSTTTSVAADDDSTPLTTTKMIIETDETNNNPSSPRNKGIAGQEDTPEEITSFLNQFQYAGAEFGLKLSPADMGVELLDYQKEGVGWMARREHFHSGGIMADFLGMGKTVQMLALCCARHQNPRLLEAERKKKQEQKRLELVEKKKTSDGVNSIEQKTRNVEVGDDEVTAAIKAQQKRVDALSFTTTGEPFRLQTVINQLGQIPTVNNVSKITRPARELSLLDNDVKDIIRNYGTVSENETEEALHKVRVQLNKWLIFAGKYYQTWETRARTFLSDGARTQDGSGADSSDVDSSQSFDMTTPEMRTLIIVPASLVFQWKHEIETKIDQEKRPCKILVFHGSNRRSDKFTAIDLETHDFVITTYESVVRSAAGAIMIGDNSARRRTSITQESMGAQMFNRSAAGPLFKVRWKRIILDEAHYVRNEKTTRFKCIQHLMGLKRWAVTATPLHNSIQDLQTLLSFVGQPKLPLFEANESLLLKDAVLQRAIARSLQPAFLRRTPIMSRRGIETTLLVLPSKDDAVVRGDLSHKEIILYNDALTKRQNALSLIAGKGFMHVFAMMTLLRQACCHPWLTEGKKSDHQVCFLCNFETLNPLVTRCGHAFCRECLNMAFKAQSGDREDESIRLPCPACEVPIPISIFQRGGKTPLDIVAKLRERKWVSSSKVDMLLTAIRNIIEKDAEEKLVVFAQFTSLLDVVTIAIEKTFPGLAFVRIDGSMTLKARNGLIHAFSYQKDVKILLASKMAMGVGLNLTAANNVIILDPWWNPQVEEQAVHRCHRIGQKKHVTVQRFVMNDTIEQYCYDISKKKKDFGDAVLKAATSEEESGGHQTTAKTIAQMIAKEGVKPILTTSSSSSINSSSSSSEGNKKKVSEQSA